MKISFITTVFNEEKTIKLFLDSLFIQTKKVHEIIIVDGGSTDNTVAILKSYGSLFRKKKIAYIVLVKKGNRSVGRNEAIKHASGEIIVCSDAGNILDKKWVEEITRPYSDRAVDVVAGYYKGKPKDIFQESLIPYVLVMPDQVDPKTFLPATRSMAFTKNIWKKAGKFPEQYSHNEDYVFAHKLKEIGAKIIFAKKAIVNWLPRTTLKQTNIMFFRFAFGDSESGIIRDKVLLLLLRYFIGLYFLFLSILYRNSFSIVIAIFLVFLYSIWSIKKNYRYVNKKEAFMFLPLFQFCSDAGVIAGTIAGFLTRIKKFDYLTYVKQNRYFLGICAVYTLLMLVTIHDGAPNRNHPYPYNMDEWHQLHAVLETFKNGTPNTAGAANGTMFHFLLSGFYLIPFVLIKYISIASLRVFDLDMRVRLFEILRFSTLIWGLLSLFVFHKLIELTKAAKRTTLFIFTFSPIWLTLSGYFKYDIGLMFWLLLSIYVLCSFVIKPTNRTFLIAVVPCALAFCVKVSAIPLFLVLFLSFFLFYPEWKRNVTYAFLGVISYVSIILFFGMPDTIFGKGNIVDYLINNIFQTPATMENISFSINPYFYLFFKHFPIIFGPALFITFLVSLIFMIFCIIKEGIQKYRVELLLTLLFAMFLLSLVPLQIYAAGNRSLVLLPFFALFSGIGISKIQQYSYGRVMKIMIITLLCLFQAYYSFTVIYLKSIPAPQEISSQWIIRHIPEKTLIGIENIPIYQGIPDILQKEFYFAQSKGGNDNRYLYSVIDSKSSHLPGVVVITNGEFEAKYLKNSPKKDLINRLVHEGYKDVRVFRPDMRFFPISDFDYFYSGLLPFPYTTSVYIKQLN